jgi:DNA-binding NarL/FixJ family response regulator
MLTREPPSKGSAEKIKVIILEDGRYDRLGMITELSAEPEIELLCAIAQPQELLAAIEKHRPEVAVIDLRIYDDDAVGLEVIREVKHAALPVKVVVLTAFPELTNFLTAFDLGVEAFVKKAAVEPRPTLSELIMLVAGGGRYYDPDLMRVMRQHLEGIRPPQEDDALILPVANTHVSNRELEVLHQLAADRTIQQIADALVVSIHTVKTHISNIKGKLGARNRRDAVLIAASTGLLNPPSQEK